MGLLLCIVAHAANIQERAGGKLVLEKASNRGLPPDGKDPCWRWLFGQSFSILTKTPNNAFPNYLNYGVPSKSEIARTISNVRGSFCSPSHLDNNHSRKYDGGQVLPSSE